MITRTLEVKNRTGLHARPISQIIKLILGFLKLGAKFGTKVEIEIDGEDETELLKELESLFYSNFGE